MFTIKAKDGLARTGVLNTVHNDIITPFYMPVATQGNIKFMDLEEAYDIGYRAVISNALVSFFNPTLEVIGKFGGLHKFMNWNGALVTDSGGFQLNDDSFMIKTTEEGALFKNPFSGQKVLMTPEKLIGVQEALGSDIAMVLDDMPRFGNSYEEIKRSSENTFLWAKKAKLAHKKENQLIFGICQGGTYMDLREKSAKEIASIGFDGLAIGGLAIGEPLDKMFDMVRHSISFLPENKPRYLMGVGSPVDMLKAISNGVDMFDSTFPTQNARHGTLFSFEGKIKILNSIYRLDAGPIEEGCDCYACKNFSRAFIRHMLKTGQPLGKRLATSHNLFFMNRFMERIRDEISKGTFSKFKEDFESKFV